MAKNWRLKPVIVTWGDAWAGEEFYDAEGIENDHKPRLVESVGYLLKRDKTGVTICGCADSHDEFDRVLFVPAGMVVRVEVLSDKKQRAK